MSKILFSAVVTDARNKIGGTVFSKGRAGAYIRTKPSPTQPRTAAQLAVRANFSAEAKAWSGTLTATERAAWIAFAAAHPTRDVFGNTVVLTGLQMYMQIARTLHTIGQVPLASPPATFSVDDPGGLTLAYAAGPPVLYNVSSVNAPATGDYLVITAAPPLSPGRSTPGSTYRILSTPAGTTSQPINIHAAYIARYGTPASGQLVYVGLAFVSPTTGAMSIPYTSSITQP